MIIYFIDLSENTLKDAFVWLGRKLGYLSNQIISTVSMDIIWHLDVWYLLNYSDLWGGTTNILYPLSYLV